jgi:hypothetical protein
VQSISLPDLLSTKNIHFSNETNASFVCASCTDCPEGEFMIHSFYR